MQDLYNLKIEAEDLFLQKNYKKSMLTYANILFKFPNDKDARIGVMLNDMAFEIEEEAQAIFDYYLILKKRDDREAAEIIKDVIETFDINKDQLSDSIKESNDNLNSNPNIANGIAYTDFQNLVQKDGEFKRVFENIMFSTKIIIVGKSEFVNFLTQLIDNDFDDMALNYIEGAVEVFKSDEDIRHLCDKLSEKKFEN